jgi:DnaJ-class molecular chaperone
MGRLRNYYEVLGVPRNADEAAIKSAYRRLVGRLHPDVGGPESSEAFREVQAAFETLSDLEQRQRYDATLTRRETRPAARRVDHTTLDTRGLIEWSREAAPSAALGEVLLTPSEAATGGILPLELPVRVSCSACSGTGGLAAFCCVCEGEGIVECRVPCDLELPPGVRDGAVYQICLNRPALLTLFVTISVLSR